MKPGQKQLCFGCGSPDHFVIDNKGKPSELVGNFRNTRYDIMLVGCIDFMLRKNAAKDSSAEEEILRDEKASHTPLVSKSTIGAMDSHFRPEPAEDDEDEGEAYFTHFIASRMRCNDSGANHDQNFLSRRRKGLRHLRRHTDIIDVPKIHITFQDTTSVHDPLADRNFKLLRHARPDDSPSDTLKILDDISNRCDQFQKIKRVSHYVPNIFMG
eukprot:IDg3229t1